MDHSNAFILIQRLLAQIANSPIDPEEKRKIFIALANEVDLQLERLPRQPSLNYTDLTRPRQQTFTGSIHWPVETREK